MQDLSKKVIVLNNFTSPYIAEALIVLKDYDPRLEGKILEEAERVVSEYIQKSNSRYKKDASARIYKKNGQQKAVRKASKLKVFCAIAFVIISLLGIGIYNNIIG